MKEIADILRAFDAATSAGRKTALATVVSVEGSSYRRPGARMLVEEDGTITGAISGGCLEGDAKRRALLAMSDGQNRLVSYDTTDEDNEAFGVQLGCNGIVHILFEPISLTVPNHPLKLLRRAHRDRRDACVATLFTLDPGGAQPGTCLLIDGGAPVAACGAEIVPGLIADAQAALAAGHGKMCAYASGLQALIDVLMPPVSLVVFGGGNDAMPLIRLACSLGWRTTVVDGRPGHPTAARFPEADARIVASGEAAFPGILTDARTALVLMTHNYPYDLAVLKAAAGVPHFYLGVLGPKAKLARLMEESGRLPDGRIHGPTGLDLGAETAEEVALSVAAEILAVQQCRDGGKLNARVAPIHARPLRDAA